MTTRPLRIAWLDDGLAGHANQALGLAEALHRLRPSEFERVDASRQSPVAPFRVFQRSRETVDYDLVIACGRRATRTARRWARLKGDRPFVVHIQDPRRRRADFDVILAPRHDRIGGGNVISLIGGPHRIDPESCAGDALALRESQDIPPGPLCSLLFGGATKNARLKEDDIVRWIAAAKAVREAGYGLLVTTSRRTGPTATATLKAALIGPDVVFWDGEPLGRLANPYKAFLGLADHIVTTSDSVSMAVEAASTGKPVHILRGPDGRPKLRALADQLCAYGAARPFAPPPWRAWRYEPLTETLRAAHEVLRRYDLWRRVTT